MGIDLRPSVSAAFDGAGLMIAYSAFANEHLSIGSATFRSAGANGNVAWGTWIGGPTRGAFYASKPLGDFTFDGTIDPGTGPGTLTAATLVVDFASGHVAADVTLNLPDGPASILTTGGTGNPAGSEVAISGTTLSGSRATAFALYGVFVDDGATSAVLSYVVFPTDGVTARGAFAVEKTATPPDF